MCWALSCDVLVVLAVCCLVNAGDPFFSRPPEDLSVSEGNTVELQCEVSDLQSGHFVQWIKSGIAISFPNRTCNTGRLRDIFVIGEPSRYTMNGDFTRGEFNLRIANTIRSEDQGEYRCIVNDDFGPVSLSPVVRLTVNLVSVAEYPNCLPVTTRKAYMEGDILNTECTFRNSQPLPVLAWARNNVYVSTGDRVYQTLPDTRREWALTAEDNGAVFTCVATGAALPVSQTCTIGPIEVYYKPETTVIPQIADVTAGESITFTCSVSANPEPPTYLWDIDGVPLNLDSGRYHLSTDRTVLTILRTVDSDDNMVVACSVENIAGSSSATSVLFVSSSPSRPTSTPVVVRTEHGIPRPGPGQVDSIKTTTAKSAISLETNDEKQINDKVISPNQESQVEEKEEIALSVPVMAASITGGIIFLIVMVIIIIELSRWNQKRRKKKSEEETRRVSGYYDVNLSTTASQAEECKQKVSEWLSRTLDDKYHQRDTDRERTLTLKITDVDDIPKIRPFDAGCYDCDSLNYVTGQEMKADDGLSGSVRRHYYSEISVTESMDSGRHVYSIPLDTCNYYPTARSPAQLVVDYGVIDPLD
ncbi:cell adhesion molecule 2-like [Saccoglossus kowalevskii]